MSVLENVLVLIDVEISQQRHEGIRIDQEEVSFYFFHFQYVVRQKAGVLEVGTIVVNEMLEGTLKRVDERLDVLIVVEPTAF